MTNRIYIPIYCYIGIDIYNVLCYNAIRLNKDMQELTKQYQVWTYSEGSAYALNEYDTLEEAVMSVKYSSDYYITKRVAFKVEELEETQV